MTFLFSFVSCKPFVYLIGSLCVAGIFQLIHNFIRGERTSN